MAKKKHWTDSQNSDTVAPSGRELYHLQFSLQEASPETFGYALVYLAESTNYEAPHYTVFSSLQ
jgi:hypothetical protein